MDSLCDAANECKRAISKNTSTIDSACVRSNPDGMSHPSAGVSRSRESAARAGAIRSRAPDESRWHVF